MKYGMIIQEITWNIIEEYPYNQDIKSLMKLSCGSIFTFRTIFTHDDGEVTAKAPYVGDNGYRDVPRDWMVEISESEYNRIKALREPTKELTLSEVEAEIEEKLGYKIKIIKES